MVAVALRRKTCQTRRRRQNSDILRGGRLRVDSAQCMSDPPLPDPLFDPRSGASFGVFSACSSIRVRQWGLVPYAWSREAMRSFSGERGAASPDEIWLLEHPPVYTLGQRGRREDLLCETGIEVVNTERGGQITYHGPGQVIAYVLIDLKRRNIKVREFVALLEDALIATLARYNVVGVRKPGAPGVYVLFQHELQKIAALGLKITRGCSYHGVSLNVAMDLAPFGWINPCGYPGLRSIDLASLGVAGTGQQVGLELAEALVVSLSKKEVDAPVT